MRIAILGAAGLLGQACRQAFGDSVIALDRSQADLTRPLELRLALERIRPTHVVNCVGYTQVDQAESEPNLAFAMNTLGTRNLTLICRDLDCALLHVSTDYVFGADLARSVPYGEADLPGPVNVYGTSKLAAEHIVRSVCRKHFIVRTCGLYGTGGKSDFVRAMIGKAMEGRPIRVVSDQICTPTAAGDLAIALAELLSSQAYGLYHVTNSGACSWFEFARAIFAFRKLEVRLIPISSQDYGAAATRPRYSVLDSEKWRRSGFTPLRPWEEALTRFLEVR